MASMNKQYKAASFAQQGFTSAVTDGTQRKFTIHLATVGLAQQLELLACPLQ